MSKVTEIEVADGHVSQPAVNERVFGLACKIAGEIMARLATATDLNLPDPSGEFSGVRIVSHHNTVKVIIDGMPTLKSSLQSTEKQSRHFLKKRLQQSPRHVEVLRRALHIS